MKRELFFSLGLAFFSIAGFAQEEAPATCYVMHSGGCHISRNAEGRAVLEAGDVANPQMMTLTPTGDGAYTISAPGGGYLSLEGRWDAKFLDDPASTAAQFVIEDTGNFFKKIKCRANNKYIGTDAMTAGSYIFADKDGRDSRHYWYMTTNPTEQPPYDVYTYVINPGATRQQFEGWGVSLCWWANMCGKWSDEKIDEIVDWLVSPEGLNFRIFRYNIGGGDDPENTNCTAHHMGNGKGLRAEMEGFKDSSDGPYIWTRDEAQRKIMLKIKEKRPDAIFEAFSNSAPYYMTYSGCVAGNTNSSTDNLRPECYEEFAHYLVDVCKHYKDTYGIEFRTLDPFNEPMTSYWGANGGQEGCHFDVNSQIEMVKVLYPILKASGLNTMISASDETSVAQAVNDFIAFRNAGILDMIGQVNTHTYTADDRSRNKLSSLCREKKKPLWMSEVGLGGSGFGGNLSLAQKLINDMRYIMPSAWVDWQYIEEGNDQWCLVRGDFAKGTYEKVPNYYVRSHFSRFIKEGYTILTSMQDNTLTAISPNGDELVLVALNNGAFKARHNVDLSMFATVGAGIKAYVTSEREQLAEFDGVRYTEGKLVFELDPSSIMTIVIPVTSDNIVNNMPEEGGKYLICPRNSASEAVETTAEGAVVLGDIDFDKSQVWTVSASTEGAVTFTNGNGEIITESAPSYALGISKEPAAGQNFKIEDIDGIFCKVMNEGGSKAFDLQSENNTAGTPVGVWAYAADAPVHRQWIFVNVPETLDLSGVELSFGRESEDSVPFCISTSDGVLTVTSKADSEGTLAVYSASGARIYHNILESGQRLSLPLATGVYIVSFSGTGFNVAKTILVG